MEFQRSSGVLLHVSSLPSYGGIGDMGPAAYDFVRFLAAARQHVWQVLPLCPTGYGNSPYASSSAFAGNPYLISLEHLSDWGWIAGDRIAGLAGRGGAVTFDEVETRKLPLLYEAAGNFLDRGARDAKLASQWALFEKFCEAEKNWLLDYAMYSVLRAKYSTGAWTAWPEDVRKRDSAALDAIRREHGRLLAQEQVLQFAFALQWHNLREAAREHGIRILGDVAIFVNMDSSDVWMHPELFELDEELKPVRVAGVPPDYFSATGQRWGNPLYRWDVLREQGFDWWVQRMARSRQIYDIVRLDHFRGFEAFWAIPAEEATAINGIWVKAPGLELFHALERALGPLAIVAEDLGLITKDVDELRKLAGFPGMRVIQFGFSDKGAHMHLPHQYTLDTVAYTGTHDNDTTRGWWEAGSKVEREATIAYIGQPPMAHDGKSSPVWPLWRAVSSSVAQLAIVPAQDLFEMGSEARMNTPAVAQGNWSWRAPEAAWTAALAKRMAALVEVTDRENNPLEKQGTGNREQATEG
jgi:4-alpha-glucanotransferase